MLLLLRRLALRARFSAIFKKEIDGSRHPSTICVMRFRRVDGPLHARSEVSVPG
jgi:hypothetical protein